MKDKLFTAAIIFSLTTIFLCAGLVYAQDQRPELRTFTGNVLEVDWVGSVMTVEGVENMTFSVGPETKVTQGTGSASFSDIEQGDPVAVKYYEDPSGDSRAVRIDIKKPYPVYN